MDALSRKSINVLKALEITKSRKHVKFDLTCIDFALVDDQCVQYFILEFITISFSSRFRQFKENSNVHDGVHEQYGQASCQYPSSKIYVPIHGLSYSLSIGLYHPCIIYMHCTSNTTSQGCTCLSHHYVSNRVDGESIETVYLCMAKEA